jgi:hypothetical protein
MLKDSKEYVKDFKGLQKTSMDFIKDRWTLGTLAMLLNDSEVTSNTRDSLRFQGRFEVEVKLPSSFKSKLGINFYQGESTLWWSKNIVTILFF